MASRRWFKTDAKGKLTLPSSHLQSWWGMVYEGEALCACLVGMSVMLFWFFF